MRIAIDKKTLIALLLSAAVSSGCGTTSQGSIPSPDDDRSQQVVKTRQDTSMENEDQGRYTWRIAVTDSTTVKMGQVESTTSLDISATNAAKGIKGHYFGKGSGWTKNSNAAYRSTSEAGTASDLQWDFTIDDAKSPPGQDENDALAPLVPEENGDGALAPLVPDDADALAPLTDGKPADYEGTGTMTISPRTATLKGAGVSATKTLERQTFPTKVYIFGNKVRLELKSPQGSVFFDGTLEKAE